LEMMSVTNDENRAASRRPDITGQGWADAVGADDKQIRALLGGQPSDNLRHIILAGWCLQRYDAGPVADV
jgi:hypothetical protein